MTRLQKLWNRLAIPIGLIGCLMACTANLFAADSSPPPPGLVAIEVFPSSVVLPSIRSGCQLVVTGTLADGRLIDLTRTAEYVLNGPEIVQVDSSRVQARQDGSTELTVSVAGLAQTVPVTVSGTEQPDPIRLRTEVLAVLTKQGCNSGSCHGSPQGKNGFSLSLLAYDPAADERALIHGGLGRRVSPIEPTESLLLKKPLLRVPHVGGKKLHQDELAYRILHDWICEGARPDPPAAAICAAIEVFPAGERELHLPDATQQISVRAKFQDGTIRDVTELATYQVSHAELIRCSEQGLVRGRQRGVAAVTVRYLDHVTSLNLTIVPEQSDFPWPEVAESGEIDRLVHQQLKRLRIPPSGPCDDETFLRRVFLDLTGLLPLPEQARAFLSDDAADKRARLIDTLLDSEEFARFWAQKSADLMRVNPLVLDDGRAVIFSNWLRDSWKANQPFDEFVHELLTASGDPKQSQAANYFLAIPDNETLTEATAQLFMGSRINCAKCHNHPFESWTQDDYYRIAAVFVRTKNQQGKVVVSNSGEANNPRTGQAMLPWGLDVSAPAEAVPNDRRELFVDWLTDEENPYFAHVEVNRMWGHLLGRGIVEPVDDFRSSNPPSHPALLDFLAEEFVRSGYDRKQMIRLICNSQTYQRSSESVPQNADDVAFFSCYRPRRLSAEQLHDAIGYATRTLPPTETIARDLPLSTVQRDEILSQLPGLREDWEAGLREPLKEVPCWQGSWRYTGSFGSKTFEEALETEFGPEVDLDFTFERTYKNGTISWQSRPDWRDGETHLQFNGDPGPFFLARTIQTGQPGPAVITVAGNGTTQVWLNGQLVLDCREKRGLKVDDHRLEVDLQQGENQLLIKFVNSGGLWGFYYNLVSFNGAPPLRLGPPVVQATTFLESLLLQAMGGYPAGDLAIPVDVAELVILPPERRTDAQQKKLEQLQELTHDELVAARDRVSRLTDWLDYKTQRPYHDLNPFLQAFGQPLRESACACERIHEPTIDQALQTMNGDLVRERTVEGVAEYGLIADDAALVEALYQSAFTRTPTEQERQIALDYIAQHADRTRAIEDLLWAILNTREFQFQH